MTPPDQQNGCGITDTKVNLKEGMSNLIVTMMPANGLVPSGDWTSVIQLGSPYIDGLVQERRNSIANTMELRLSCTIDGLVQERRNSIANALELRLSCTNPSI